MLPNDKPDRFVIAALGASAGGLVPLEDFFENMPSDSGVAFIVVQHLSPDHPSSLTEILTRCTSMHVDEVRNNTRVAANHIYVIPPNANLTIENRILHTAPPMEIRGRRTPIDNLFSSLAEDCGEDAVCIMLSGTGTDGTLGLRSVKEYGGMAMAQNLESAKYDAMLRSAISTGLVDHVLPVSEMPAKLIDYVEHLKVLGPQVGDTRQPLSKYSSKIHSALRRRVGYDFSEYKEGTIARRVERRMKALQIDGLERYVKVLEEQAEEADLLFKDLLIGVTHFFRDTQAFDALATQVIPKLFEDADKNRQVRACIVGCATGEEAYSVAILLREHADTLDNPPEIKVFATDIDERGLEMARKGYYPAGIAEHVNPERLERFFVKHDGGYQVKKALRELCLFSIHSFIKDPPFSRLNLISCRNVMIYLGDALQRRVIPLFHYALRPGGYLFLGPSETVNAHRELFRAIDKKNRIFKKKDDLIRTGVAFPLGEVTRSKPSVEKTPHNDALQLPKRLERIILRRYAPASVIVHETGEAVYFSGDIARYLEQPTGSPDPHIVNMAREGLQIPLRAAFHRATSSNERVVQRNVVVQTSGGLSSVDLRIEPLAEMKDAHLFMVVIMESAAENGASEGTLQSPDATSGAIIRQLENDLQAAREHAQAMFEELESSNEELSSANEEFQSTNEELETSKEELQSFNEELETVNAELNRKVTELDASNSDLQNLLSGTQIATVFLDIELRIRNFTPTAGLMFHLLPGDLGRPITDLATQFVEVDLVEDAKDVLATLSIKERLVLGKEDKFYQLRILPYRTVNNVIAGVVLIYIDVTQLRRAEQLAEQARAYAESIVDTVREPLVVLDTAMCIISASKAFYETFGVAPEHTLGKVFFELGQRQWDIVELRELLSEVLPKNQKIDDYQVKHNFPNTGLRTMLINGRRLVQGEKNAPLILLAIEDITQRKEIEEKLQSSEERLRSLFEQSSGGIVQTDLAGKLLMVNEGFCRIAGRTSEELLKLRMQDITHPDDLSESLEKFTALAQDRGAEFTVEKRYLRPDGSQVWVETHVSAIVDRAGQIRYMAAAVMDIGERKRLEKQRADMEERERALAVTTAVREAEAELARVSRALTIGELATSIAHEVNQPLAGIVTNAEACVRWLQARVPNLEEARDSLELIVRDGNRASEIIRRIRKFLNKDAPQSGPLNINEVIHEAIALAQTELSIARIAVHFELTPHLPVVWADRVQLQQVILNLIVNASEAMAPVEEQKRLITVISKESEIGGVIVTVRDSGVGLTAQKLDRIFDAFFTTKPTGMGMGLSITRSIIEAHGGRIWALSTEGEGTMINFTIPGELEK